MIVFYGLVETQCIWNFSKVLVLSGQMRDLYVSLTCFCLYYSDNSTAQLTVLLT